MTEPNPTWSKNEFHVYLLCYCANADFIEKDEEFEYIKSKFDETLINKMHKIFEKDSDYQRIQKLQTAFNGFNFSEYEKEELIKETKEIFMADGKFHILEQNAFRGLKHLFGL